MRLGQEVNTTYQFNFILTGGRKMKKKLVSALMCATMAVTMLAGCGNGSKNGTEAADGGTEAAESKVVTNTYGDSKGTHLEMWTFVELHAQHYGTMVEQWNKDHPDKTIEITCTTYPYNDMHTKLLTSLEARIIRKDFSQCSGDPTGILQRKSFRIRQLEVISYPTDMSI